MTAFGSLASQVQTLEWRLADLQGSVDVQATYRRYCAIAALHPEVHGPEDQNWCPTCNTNWPCPTRKALAA